MRRLLIAKIAALLLLAGALVACDLGKPKSPFQGVDVTGAPYGKAFSLTDHTGKRRTLAEFRGKVVVLFFGFTQCPDVCPSTLSTMADVVKSLGPDGERVQVVFVTIDPARDTPELLAQYVPAFNPAFIGLRGNDEETKAVAKEFKIFYEQRPGKTAQTYTMDHSAQLLAFDRQGNLRLLFMPGITQAQITSDLRILLNG